jgi:hypothetical protein
MLTLQVPLDKQAEFLLLASGHEPELIRKVLIPTRTVTAAQFPHSRVRIIGGDKRIEITVDLD